MKYCQGSIRFYWRQFFLLFRDFKLKILLKCQVLKRTFFLKTGTHETTFGPFLCMMKYTVCTAAAYFYRPIQTFEIVACNFTLHADNLSRTSCVCLDFFVYNKLRLFHKKSSKWKKMSIQFFTFEVHNIEVVLNLISFPLRASHLRWAACDVHSFCAAYVI